MRALIAALTVMPMLAADVPESAAQPRTLSALIDSSPKVVVSRNPDDAQIVAVYIERESQWTGHLSIYHRTGDLLDWQYSFPKTYEEYRGHYVISFRWVSLRQISHPVLEIIESTHMGNGSLRIFEPVGRELRLLLDTQVRGRFWSPPIAFQVPEHGEARFEGEHLHIEYHSPADQAADSIVLTGSVAIVDIQGVPMPSKKFEQSCVWNPAERVFVPQQAISP